MGAREPPRAKGRGKKTRSEARKAAATMSRSLTWERQRRNGEAIKDRETKPKGPSMQEDGALGHRRGDALRVGGGHTRWWRDASRRRGEEGQSRGARVRHGAAAPRGEASAEEEDAEWRQRLAHLNQVP